jgi:hypothetical protein
MRGSVSADISNAKSVLQELRAIVPDLPSVPLQPIIFVLAPASFAKCANTPSASSTIEESICSRMPLCSRNQSMRHRTANVERIDLVEKM